MKFTAKHTKTHPVLYEITINMGGLVHSKIRKLTYNEDFYGWWDKTGDYGFQIDDNRPWGLDRRGDGCWHFTTPILKEAKTFHAGAMAIAEFIQQLWFNQYDKKK